MSMTGGRPRPARSQSLAGKTALRVRSCVHRQGWKVRKAARDSDIVAQGYKANPVWDRVGAKNAPLKNASSLPKRPLARVKEKERERPAARSPWHRCRLSRSWEEQWEFREIGETS